MRNRASLIVGTFVLAMSMCHGTIAFAQEPPADEPASPAETEAPPPAETGDEQEEKKKHYLGLYFAVAGGSADVDDINPSVITRSAIDEASSIFSLEDQLYARAAVGWKLKNDKGDFRLEYKGYREDSYRFTSHGDSSRIQPGTTATEPVTWWDMTIENGNLVAERVPRYFDPNSTEGRPTPADVLSTDCSDPSSPYYEDCRLVRRSVPSDLQNKMQTIDLLYGQEFGGRRFSSRWWGGFRYQSYTGQIPAAAWLVSSDFDNGVGFTDGEFLKLLQLEQSSKGWGPTGAWEVDFNFFDKSLQIYIQAQAAFIFSTIEVDSGPFFTQVKGGASGTVVLAEGRLNEQRRKSIWNTAIELGLRYYLGDHVEFEIGWHRAGFLDTIILPSLIVVPEIEQSSQTGVTALYGTQDYKVQGWHVGVGFQF